MNEKDILKALDSFFSDKLKKLNLYILPQFIWLIELYYLLLNSLIQIVDKTKFYAEFNLKPISHYIPEVVAEKNLLIMKYLNEWNTFIFLFSFGMLICGILLTLLRGISVVKNYNIIFRHSSYGMDVFLWIFLIAVTFWFYEKLNYWFPFIIIIPYLWTKIWEKIKESLERRGFSFGD